MTTPKERRFTADEMELMASDLHEGGLNRMYSAFRQAAATERERERIMAALKCEVDEGGRHGFGFDYCGYEPYECPACAIRRAAGLEES